MLSMCAVGTLRIACGLWRLRFVFSAGCARDGIRDLLRAARALGSTRSFGFRLGTCDVEDCVGMDDGDSQGDGLCRDCWRDGCGGGGRSVRRGGGCLGKFRASSYNRSFGVCCAADGGNPVLNFLTGGADDDDDFSLARAGPMAAAVSTWTSARAERLVAEASTSALA